VIKQTLPLLLSPCCTPSIVFVFAIKSPIHLLPPMHLFFLRSILWHNGLLDEDEDLMEMKMKMKIKMRT